MTARFLLLPCALWLAAAATAQPADPFKDLFFPPDLILSNQTAIGLTDERDGVLEHRHHAEREQIDLDQAEIGAIVLVPLNDNPPRHRRGLERHDVVETPGRHDEPTRVLPEVPRQPLYASHEIDEQADTWGCGVETGAVQLVRHVVVRVAKLEG